MRPSRPLHTPVTKLAACFQRRSGAQYETLEGGGGYATINMQNSDQVYKEQVTEAIAYIVDLQLKQTIKPYVETQYDD
jgi:hypothetical protein